MEVGFQGNSFYHMLEDHKVDLIFTKSLHMCLRSQTNTSRFLSFSTKRCGVKLWKKQKNVPSLEELLYMFIDIHSTCHPTSFSMMFDGSITSFCLRNSEIAGLIKGLLSIGFP